MALRTIKSQFPVYEEYHTFLKGMEHGSELKNYKYYLKQFSFLQNVINVLPSALYITNLETQQFLFVSKSSLSVLGYTNEEMIKKGREYILNQVHPEDLKIHATHYFQKFIEYTRQLPTEEIKKSRFSVNYRFKKKSGEYVKILQQYIVLEVNEKGYPLLSLGLVTDITAHKTDNKVVFSIAKEHKTGDLEIVSTETTTSTPVSISKRENEIIKHLTEGLSSKMIADKLSVSLHTINAHRRNILQKTKCKNTAELISYAQMNSLG